MALRSDLICNLYVIDSSGKNYLPKVEKHLKSHFHLQVFEFQSGSDFLHKKKELSFAKNQMHAVILAYSFEGMAINKVNGFDVLEVLHKKVPNAVIIMLTSPHEYELLPSGWETQGVKVLQTSSFVDLLITSHLLHNLGKTRLTALQYLVRQSTWKLIVCLLLLLGAWWLYQVFFR